MIPFYTWIIYNNHVYITNNLDEFCNKHNLESIRGLPWGDVVNGQLWNLEKHLQKKELVLKIRD